MENAPEYSEGMIDIFAHLGGVPTEVWFDNTSTLVTKICIFQKNWVLPQISVFFIEYPKLCDKI